MACEQQRCCAACGGALSRYNAATLCAGCVKIGPTALIPKHLWQRPDMLDALREHDFGRVSKLLQQWTSLTQHHIAEMVGKDQPGLSRIENAVTPRARALLAIREAQGWAASRQEKQFDEA